MAITYSVLIDWNGDGDFADSYEVQPVLESGGIGITAGRDQPRTFSPVRASKTNWTADNRDKRFSDSAGLIGANLVPYRACKVQATDGVTTWTLFTGIVDEWNISLDQYPLVTADFTALDKLAYLSTVNPNVALSNGLRTDQAIAALLDAVGWPAPDRALDTGMTTLGYWWVDGQSALAALQQIADHEQGFFYISASGVATFEYRYNRADRIGGALAATWTDTANVSRAAWRSNGKDVINKATVTAVARTLAGAPSVVWTRGSTITLGPGESIDLFATASDPYSSPILPVQATDFNIPLGALVSMVMTPLSALTTKIRLVADTAGAVVTGMQLRATAITGADVSFVAEDAASQAAYGLKTYNLDLPYLGDVNVAKDAAYAIVARYAQPVPAVDVTLKAGTYTTGTTNQASVLTVKLSALVALSLPSIGISWSTGFVEAVKHRIRSGQHETTFTVQQASFPAVFILEDPVLGLLDTGAGLGW